jgi:hypothetical protein
MTYSILNRREETYQSEVQISDTETIIMDQTTVFTTVEYDFDGTLLTVEIPHFMPADEAYITLGIENRAITEQRKLGIIS